MLLGIILIAALLLVLFVISTVKAFRKDVSKELAQWNADGDTRFRML